ncbi:hypothetical protein [Burkholderia sp. NLJ2]|uniref:hypothetical protein n=1 Tax=Burkholderia sp. NLJ2 TaxID=3090699 RepID=UPI003C6C5178
MDFRRSDAPSDELLHVAAATLLLLAGATTCANETSPWGHECAHKLIDALLALSTQHGFAQTDVLRARLTAGTRSKRTWLLAEVAFSAVPASALLKVVRRSGFHTAPHEPRRAGKA